MGLPPRTPAAGRRPRPRRHAGRRRSGRRRRTSSSSTGATRSRASRPSTCRPAGRASAPSRERGGSGRRPDDAGDERHGLRRDGGRQPRVQLRPRRPPEGREGRLVPVALGEHAAAPRTAAPAFREYLVKTVGGVRVGDPGPDDAEHPGLGAGDEPAGPRRGRTRSSPRSGSSRSSAERSGATLVVVLFHSGLEVDPETGVPDGTDAENRVVALAREVPGIDLILTGHSHRRIPLTRSRACRSSSRGAGAKPSPASTSTLEKTEAPVAGRRTSRATLLPSDASVAAGPRRSRRSRLRSTARRAAGWTRRVAEAVDAVPGRAGAPRGHGAPRPRQRRRSGGRPARTSR